MTGSVAIDVAIGLIFIFLLYSLLASVLLEIISTNFGIRASNLRRAIYRMLNDDADPKKNTDFIYKVVRSIAALVGKGYSQKGKGLAKEFFKSPGIKYLGRQGLFVSRGPSSISAEQFSKALIGTIVPKSTNARDQAKSISNYFQNPAQRIQLKKDGTPVLDADGNKVKLSDNQASSSGIQYLEFLFNQAQGDMDHFTVKVEEWFEEMMLVATEWYKRYTQVWLFLIGLGIAFSLNLNTLYLSKILSKDNKAREQIVEMSKSYLENNDSLKEVNAMTREELESHKKELVDQSEKLTQILGISKAVPEMLTVMRDHIPEAEMDEIKLKTASFERRSDSDFIAFNQPIELPYLNLSKYVEVKADYYSPGSQLKFKKGKFDWCYKYLGYILTALAISLGAPFWFDLLNKIMQLRGAVSQKKAVSQTATNSSSNTNRITKG